MKAPARFDADRKAAFVAALSQTGNVSASARAIGICYQTAYGHRERYPEFAAAWDVAERIAADALEAEARRRAVDGVERPAISGGRVVKGDDGKPVMLREYSDRLLETLLKAHKPQFRESRVEHSGSAGTIVMINVIEADRGL